MTNEPVTLDSLRREAVDTYGVWQGLRGDVEANLGKPSGPGEATRIWLRALVSPEIRLCLLLRLGARSSRWTGWLWRNLLIALHASEIQPGAILAPGLRVPAPFGIAIAATVQTDPDVMIGNRTSFAMRTESGQINPRRTSIGRGARILPNSTLMGGVRVGEGATVGPHTLVTHRVKPGTRTIPHDRH